MMNMMFNVTERLSFSLVTSADQNVAWQKKKNALRLELKKLEAPELIIKI